MKSLLVIGAGKFGHHLAENLCAMGNDVMLVDSDETKVEEYSINVTSAEIGDYTIKSNLESLGISDFDCVFVCIGSFSNSLIIVDALTDLNANYIVAKASSDVHEKLLLKTGANKVIYPERDSAYSMAVEASYSNIFDFVKLSDETGIYEIEAPDNWLGKSLEAINVRRTHNITVVAYKNTDGNVIAITKPDYIFCRDEHVFVLGEEKNIRKLAK